MGRRSCSIVGISSDTVGWMGTDREITVYGFRAYTTSRLCTASSPFRPKIASHRIRLEDTIAEKHLVVSLVDITDPYHPRMAEVNDNVML